MKLEDLKKLIKEELKRTLNENDAEFDLDKIYKAKLEEFRVLKDLDLGDTYEVKYKARENNGDKDTGTIEISITKDDLKKYGEDTSIQNYLTDYLNIDPKTGKDINDGYTVYSIDSVKKLENQSFNESLTPKEQEELYDIEDEIRYKANSYGTSITTSMKERYNFLISKRDKSLKK
jgi:hypothetical protein